MQDSLSTNQVRRENGDLTFVVMIFEMIFVILFKFDGIRMLGYCFIVFRGNLLLFSIILSTFTINR